MRTRREGQALALCARCPFRAACLARATDRAEKDGIWGGRIFPLDEGNLGRAA